MLFGCVKPTALFDIQLPEVPAQISESLKTVGPLRDTVGASSGHDWDLFGTLFEPVLDRVSNSIRRGVPPQVSAWPTFGILQRASEVRTSFI
jgi:hypothetical protein